MEDPLPWLILHCAPKLSPSAAIKCLDYFGSAESICNAQSSDLLRAGLDQITVQFIRDPDRDALKQDLLWAGQTNHHLLFYAREGYPKRLCEIKNAPLLLFASGDISLLNEPQIAMVGSRRPTGSGLRNARLFSQSLSRSGFVITSGLAAGIDSCAHQTALDENAPTIAVIGTGMDIIYPRRNKNLAQKIIQHGLIVSEFSCGTPAFAGNFPRRNRLMSGLSHGVLVVEAAKRSGSLITAYLAAEQGREVFALPGSIHNPLAHGCHQLIQNGAKLVQTVEDILIEFIGSIEISDQTSLPDQAQSKPISAAQKKLLAQMEFDTPTSIDKLVECCHLPASEVSSMLLLLELDGFISTENHTYVRLV